MRSQKKGAYIMTEQNITVETYTIPKLLGVKDLAKEFRLPTTAIRQWINNGQLPVVVCGKKYLVNCTTFSKFLEGSPITEPRAEQPIATDGSGHLYAENNMGNKAARIKPIF